MRGTVVTDTFTRTSSSGWGSTETPALAWTALGSGGTFVATDISVNGTAGIHSVNGTVAYRITYLGAFSQSYVDMAVDFSVGVMPTGGVFEPANLMFRATDTNTYYLARVEIAPSGVLTVKMFNPAGAQIGTTTTVPGITYTAGLKLRVRVQCVAKAMRMKVWPAAGTEPVAWLLSVTDQTFTGAGFVGIRSGVGSGVTNTLPVVFTYDNFNVVQLPDFPRDKLPLTVLAAFGADLSKDPSTWPWTSITADVRVDTVRVTQGRADDTSQASPAACSFQLNNTSMAYSAYNAAGPNWPNVRRNTPIWVMVDPATEFFGYANGFTPGWDVTGKVPIVNVSASGTLRRLMQGKTRVESPMRHAILAANPVAYYPMEDKATSTGIASGLPGAPAMPQFGGTWNFAADSTLLGSAPTPTLTATSTCACPVNHDFSASGNWQVDWYTKISSIPASQETILLRTFTSGTVAIWDFVLGNDGTNNYQAVHGFNASGALLVDSGHFACYPWQVGQWNHYRLMLQRSGGNVNWQLVEFPIFGSGGVISGTFAGTPGNPGVAFVPAGAGLAGASMSHLAVFDAWDFSATDIAAKGYGPDPVAGIPGERATIRLNRICGELGIPITIIGTSNTTMGPQPIDIPINVLRECEAADGGLLVDGFGPGLTYITRAARYNLPAALTLDVAAGQVAPPFAPVDDDQRNRNIWKVDRKGGSSATAQDKTGPLGTDPLTGIGVYDSSVTLNIDTDGVLPDYASWLVHLGTVEGFRYPSLNLNLAKAPALIDSWPGTRLLSRIDVLNISGKATGHAPGTVSLLTEGYTETLGPKTWKVAANCSRYDPWQVFVLDTDRLDADPSSKLVAGINSTATTFQVSTAAIPGALWTTDSAEWTSPKALYLNVAGEQMKVTNITGASSPQTFTVVRSVNGVVKTQAANAYVGLWQPRPLAL